MGVPGTDRRLVGQGSTRANSSGPAQTPHQGSLSRHLLVGPIPHPPKQRPRAERGRSLHHHVLGARGRHLGLSRRPPGGMWGGAEGVVVEAITEHSVAYVLADWIGGESRLESPIKEVLTYRLGVSLERGGDAASAGAAMSCKPFANAAWLLRSYECWREGRPGRGARRLLAHLLSHGQHPGRLHRPGCGRACCRLASCRHRLSVSGRGSRSWTRRHISRRRQRRSKVGLPMVTSGR